MIQVQKGTVRVGKMMVHTHQWLMRWMSKVSFTHAKILNSGMNSNVSGMRYVRKTPIASVAEPQNFMRASANAAGMLISIVTITTTTETIAELMKNVW